MEPTVAATVSCANCGASLVGEYCHVCGQKRIADDWQSVPRFLRQFAGELVTLDFKTVRSIAALQSQQAAAEFWPATAQYLGR